MRPQPRSPTLRRQSPLHLPATPYPSHPLSLIMGRRRPSLFACCHQPSQPPRHSARAMRHNMHKQLYTRRVQTLHTKSPKLYTRRNQAPHTKKPFEPYRTNLFRKQIYVQKFGHKNHIRKPSVATRKGPGRLSSSNRGPSYKYPSGTFGRLFKSNAHGSQVGHRQISTNPQTLAKLPLTVQRKTRKVQKPSHREPMEQSMAHSYILRSTLRSIRRWSHYSAAASSAFLVRRVVRVLRLGFSSSATSIFTPANSGSMRIRPQYSHTMIFLCILISS